MAFHPACRAHKRKHPVLVWHQWIGPYQNSFDPTEHGRVRSDPKDKAEQCEDRKAGTPPKHPEAEAKVLKKRLH